MTPKLLKIDLFSQFMYRNKNKQFMNLRIYMMSIQIPK